MKLYDPFGAIAGTWHHLQDQDLDGTIGGFILMGGVVIGHLVALLLVLGLAVHMARAFTVGVRDGYARSKGGAA